MERYHADGRRPSGNNSSGSGARRRKKKKNNRAIAVLVVMILLLIAAAVVAVVLLTGDKPAPASEPVATATSVPQETPAADDASRAALSAIADAGYMTGTKNILVIGVDRANERIGWSGYHADSLMLVSVNFDNMTAAVTAIPRGTYCKLPDGNYDQLLYAYTMGSGDDECAQKTVATVEQLFGVTIDNYAAVDIPGVKAIVDTMQGVDFDVNVAGTVNEREITIGAQHLDGQRLMDVTRIVADGETDLIRLSRGQDVLIAFFRQVKANHQLKIIDQFYDMVKESVKTDLDVPKIAALALAALDTDLGAVAKYVIPGSLIEFEESAYFGVNIGEATSQLAAATGQSPAIDSQSDEGSVRPAAQQKADAVEDALRLISKYVGNINSKNYYVESSELKRVNNAVYDLQTVCYAVYPSLQEGTSAVNEAVEEFKDIVVPINNKVNERVEAGTYASDPPVSPPDSQPSQDGGAVTPPDTATGTNG